MKSLCVLVLSVLLALSDAFAPLSMQAHSFDDLDMLRQLLVKGVDWFKIDIDLASLDSCSRFSTWQGDNETCIKVGSDNVCCLALRGDVSGLPNLPSPFNTTEDLLRLLRHPQNQFIFKDESRKVFFALDFVHIVKWNVDSMESAFFTDFLFLLNETIGENQLNVQVVLDYFVHDWFAAVDKKCSQTPASCSETELRMTRLPFISEGGARFPSVDPFHRYRILDLGWQDVAKVCQGGFPPAAMEYPYLWWEPSTQDEMLTTLSALLQCPSMPETHRPLRNGSLIVTNQEPEMFEVYTSSLLKRGLNEVLLASSSQPRMSVLGSRLFLYHIPSPATHTLSIYSLNTSGLPLQLHLEETVAIDVPPAVSTEAAVSLSCLSDTCAVVWADGTLFTYQIGAERTLRGASHSQPTLQLPLSQGMSLVTVSGSCSSTVCAYLFVASSADCQLELAVKSSLSGQLLVKRCILDASETVVDSATISVAFDNGTSLWRGILLWSTRIDDATVGSIPVIRGAVIELNNDLTEISVKASDGATSYLDFGSEPHVQVVSHSDQLYVLEAHTDGMCQCGMIINNGDMYKCDLDISEDSKPLRSVPHLLNYNWGELDRFVDRIHSGDRVGSCDPHIMHGKFDNGAHPSIAMVTSGSDVLALEVHDASFDPSDFTVNICGAPTPRTGLVVDSWTLVHPDVLNKL
eukprot:GILJ01003303.1.p1 GENE.GILJ01003303.1~~GILJ01003303.1.p1  ORF type:complete len:689 (-),score=95.09 GILJ01003303.1:145-2211(-)